MYKLYEKVLLNRIQKWLKKESIPFPSSQQQGFQENKGCITASFNLHETVLHNQELGSKVFIAFADISKAYDTVLHHGLMYFLKKLGIKGKILNSIESCYHNISSFVRVNNFNSKCFKIKRGVRQGGVLSSFLYLVYINEVFNQLETYKLVHLYVLYIQGIQLWLTTLL